MCRDERKDVVGVGIAADHRLREHKPAVDMDVEYAVVAGDDLECCEIVFVVSSSRAARPATFGLAPQGTQYSIRMRCESAMLRFCRWDMSACADQAGRGKHTTGRKTVSHDARFGTGWHREPRARITPPGGGSGGPCAAREPRDCLVEREVRLERRGGRASPASGAASTSTCGGAAATAVSMSTGLTGITMSTPRSSGLLWMRAKDQAVIVD